MAAARLITSPSDRPSLVISSTDGFPADIRSALDDLHAAIARVSTSGTQQVVSGSSHYSLLTERDDAAEVSQMLMALFSSARALTP